jgi:hypothetical protein
MNRSLQGWRDRDMKMGVDRSTAIFMRDIGVQAV